MGVTSVGEPVEEAAEHRLCSLDRGNPRIMCRRERSEVTADRRLKRDIWQYKDGGPASGH